MSQTIENPSQEQLTVHQDTLRYESDPNSTSWNEAEALEAEVFIKAGYVESQEELAEEYKKYLPKSEFIVAERDGVIGGSVRIITYGAETGFKTVDDIKAGKLETTERGEQLVNQLDMERTLEVGTLGVLDSFRGGSEELRLSTVLFGSIYQATRKYDCDWVLASFDERFYEGFKMLFDPGVEALGPATDYMGSPTVPALIHVETLMNHAESVWSEVHKTMLEAAENIQKT